MSRMITVCDKCLCATCWNGQFMCDESDTAGIVQKSEEELLALGREHPDHWHTDEELQTITKPKVFKP